MVENTKIEWATHTFNPWIGCSKVSPGCEHCYAETLMDTRYGRVEWGVNGTRVRTSEANWRKPRAWNKAAECLRTFDCANGDHSDACPQKVRPRVFCASLADVFEDREELIPWRRDLIQLILSTPNLDWLLLTKRPENVGDMLGPDGAGLYAIDDAPVPCPQPNIWIGTSVENQEQADKRIPELIEVPAAVRFLSMEPLLGPVDLTRIVQDEVYSTDCLRGRVFESMARFDDCEPSIDWVIVGGESGANARPMHPEWARSLRDQCQAAGVALHFKQWGEWGPSEDHPLVKELLPWQPENFQGMCKVGKKAAGRLLDGRTWDEFPVTKGVTPSTNGKTGG